jgi:predicted XRE-type DNA-binding protein
MRLRKHKHAVPLHVKRTNKWGTDALRHGAGCYNEELLPSNQYNASYNGNAALACSALRQAHPARFPIAYDGLDMFKIISGMTWEKSEKYRIQLPKKEQDVLILIYQQRKLEVDIAKMFSVTQGAISARIRRAFKRLRFLKKPPPFPEPIPLLAEPTLRQIASFVTTKKICDLMKAGVMHQTEIAKKLKIAQCTVSYLLANNTVNTPKNQKFFYITSELKSPRTYRTPKIVFSE